MADLIAAYVERDAKQRAEIAALREILVECCKAAGGKCSPSASLNFMKDIPREMDFCVGRLMKAAIAIRDDLLARARMEQQESRKVVACGNGAWLQLNDAIDATQRKTSA